MDPRTERVGKNEAVFREVNERINEVTREKTDEYLCECGYANCTETVQMTVADYEDLRADPTRFALLPGHEVPHWRERPHRDNGATVQRRSGRRSVDFADGYVPSKTNKSLFTHPSSELPGLDSNQQPPC